MKNVDKKNNKGTQIRFLIICEHNKRGFIYQKNFSRPFGLIH